MEPEERKGARKLKSSPSPIDQLMCPYSAPIGDQSAAMNTPTPRQNLEGRPPGK